MATKRTIDIITEGFSDVMSARRKYELELPSGQKINVLGGYKAISIRGNITIKNFPVGVDVDLLFDLERFLKVT